MRVLAMHDPEGNISALILRPPDFPGAAGLVAAPGQLLTEVEVPDLGADVAAVADERGYQRLLEVVEQYRVEAQPEGRLTRKGGTGRPGARARPRPRARDAGGG